MGKLGTAVADANIKFSVNYNSQVHSDGLLSANGLGWDPEKFKDKSALSIWRRFPGLSRFPGLRRFPGLKRFPGLRRVPGLSRFLGLKKFPSLRRFPGLSRVPGMRGFPGLSRFPGLKCVVLLPVEAWSANLSS